MQKVALIGSGIIGQQWAALFLGAGFQVSLYGRDRGRLDAATKEIAGLIENRTHDKLAQMDIPVKDQLKHLSTTVSLEECLQDATLVQESLSENIELKLGVFNQVDKILCSTNVDKNSVILGSSTSTFPAKVLSQGLPEFKNRFLIIHPINPPIYCKLVELVQSTFTDGDAMDRAYDIMRKLGQAPVKIKKDIPGFVLNRLQFALLAESWRLVADGVVSVADLNKTMTEGLAPRYVFFGPLEVIHMNANGVEDYVRKFGRGIMDTMKTFGPTPNLEDEVALQNIKKQLEAKVPVNKVPEMRKDRDQKLAALAQFKRQFD